MPKRVQASHFPIGHAPVHVTYRLAGSIPQAELKRLLRARDERLRALNDRFATVRTAAEKALLVKEQFAAAAEFELSIDRALHAIYTGDFYLQDPVVRGIVMDSWAALHRRGDICVIALCVMGNHVHVLLKAPAGVEEVAIGPLFGRHKTYTARLANQHLGRVGEPFWVRHYFDRTVRSGKFLRALWYVVNNPVKAGLVVEWRDWAGTYVPPEYEGMLRPG